ncbi:MAG: hypothetical protein PHR71_07700 [Polaromonas sp.]|nr:hypothetical protein [Polaromonas sp.]
MDSPAAIDPTRSSQNLTREAWVEMQLVQIFMRHAQPVQYVAAAMLITVVAVLYRYVEPAGLWAWAVAVVAVTLTRSLVIHRYQRTMVGVSGLALSACWHGWSGDWCPLVLLALLLWLC